MASLWFYLSVRDNSATGQGARVTGLTPAWTLFKSLDTNGDVTPQPAFAEVGQGIYKYSYDPELNGDAVGQVDVLGGSTAKALNPGDRYVDVFPTREPSRLLTGIDHNGQTNLSPSGFDSIVVEAGINARQALSPILAASAGVVLGAGTGTVILKGGNSSITRITAATDNAGNRTSVTLVLPPAQGVSTVSSSYYFPEDYFPEAYFPFGKVNEAG
jgi:hypothetical protein